MSKPTNPRRIISTVLLLSLALGLAAVSSAGRAALQAFQAWVWQLDQHLDRETLLLGEQPNSEFGQQIARGDFNGDGHDDLLVSAPHYRIGGHAAGKAYLFAGPFAWGQELNAAMADLAIGTATSNASLGIQLAGVDLDGNGLDELILSAWSGDLEGIESETYVYPGQPQIGTGLPISYTLETNPPAWILQGTAGDLLGCDINGDHYQDLFTEMLVMSDTLGLHVLGLLGSAGGLDTPRAIELPAQADIVISGFNLDYWTAPTSPNLGCGDIDCDGFNDLVIGAFGESPNDKRTAGSIYIIQGRESFTTTRPVHLTVPGDSGAILQGSDGCCPVGFLEGDSLGSGISVADFNQDGKADIAAGAKWGDGINNWYGEGGELYIWFGRELDGSTDLIANQAAGVLYAENSNALFGTRVASGDFNGDGDQDLLSGCEGCNGEPFTNDERGMAFLFESAGELRGWQPLRQASHWLGVQNLTSGALGWSVAAADLDGDGADDLVLGAPFGYGYQTDHPGLVYMLPYPARHRTWLPLIGH